MKECFKGYKELSHVSRNRYTFGSGAKHNPVSKVRVEHPRLGSIDFDVVEGELPLLLGRTYLRTNKAKLDFSVDEQIELNGKKVSDEAHAFTLSPLAAEGSSPDPELGTSTVKTNTVSTNSAEVQEDRGLDLVAGTREERKTRPRPEVLEHPACGSECCESQSKGKLCGEFKPKVPVQPHFENDVCDINIYTAQLNKPLSEDIEEIVISEMLGSHKEGDPADQEESLPPLRSRSGNQTLLAPAEAQALNLRFPSPVWFLRAGFVKRLHLLKHSTAEKMVKFITATIPLKAKRQAPKSVNRFIDVLSEFSKFVVKNCVGCTLNMKKVSRPIGLSVIAPFSVAMVDTMCLNYQKKIYALVVADLGTGVCFAFVIRDRDEKPPDAKSCFITYLTRWAAMFGPHRKVVADRDSIFYGKGALELWEQLGIERETGASYAHFSMGSVERKIGIMRWSTDRIRDSPNSPNTVEGWDIVMATISNQLLNEVDSYHCTPSERLHGRPTSFMRNVLTDTPVTASVEKNSCQEVAENARAVFQEALQDRRLHQLLKTPLPPRSQADRLPEGTKVAYYVDPGDNHSQPKCKGPAIVVAFSQTANRYLLDHASNIIPADPLHVRPWPKSGIDDLPSFAAADPPNVDPAVLDSLKSNGVPEDDTPIGPDFSNLIHDKAVVEAPVTCQACRRGSDSYKHGHTRRPGCRLYRGGESEQVINYVSVLNGEVEVPFKPVVTKEDLLNDTDEDFSYIERAVEEVYALISDDDKSTAASDTEPEVNPNESKYMHKWEDLSKEQQQAAYDKAVKAYDDHQSWNRKDQKTDWEMHELKKKNPSVITLDATIVRDAKIKNGVLIGKVRIAPRGFRDNSIKALWYSTSPTVSSVSVRIAEMIGMMFGLTSFIFDVTDAFFVGELLRDDTIMYLKIPKEIDPSAPWRRLRREVPGCRGASSSWFRTLVSVLEATGWEQLSCDKALFVKRDKSGKLCGILPVHVDDGKLRATRECSNELFAAFKKAGIILGTIEEQKIGVPVEFTGMQFTETAEGELISQNIYISNKLKEIDTTRVRGVNDDEMLQPDLAKEYATAIGRLIWILPTQAKFSYEISYLSRYRAFPRVKHFKRVRNLIHAIKANPQTVFLPRFRPGTKVKLCVVVDAGSGEAADPPLKHRDHQCVAICLCAPYSTGSESFLPGEKMIAGLLSWSSVGVARVTHSSFDSETIVAVSSLDMTNNHRELLGEVLIGVCPPRRNREERRRWMDNLPLCELHSDSMSLVKAVRLGVNNKLAMRRSRDVSDIREAISLGDYSALLHIAGPSNFSDVGTKPPSRTVKSQALLEQLVYYGLYKPELTTDKTLTSMTACEVEWSRQWFSVYATTTERECVREILLLGCVNP